MQGSEKSWPFSIFALTHLMHWSKKTFKETQDLPKKPQSWKDADQKALKNGFRATIFSLSGDSYRGDWKDHKKDGKGLYTWKDGSTYQGAWVQDLREGTGAYSEAVDGRLTLVYNGEWKEDMMHGNGAYHYHNGDTYEGEWHQGKRQGEGKITYANGDVYEGEMLGDQRSGRGYLLLANRDRYEGMWRNDQKHGPGVFYYHSKKQKYEGEWEEGTACRGSLSGIDESDQTLPVLELLHPDKVLNSERR
ncbi:hypothetical protein PROFUN_04065 [Planoprotostelium fungivorum]|uniref:MORN repeat-containing protein 3 n=1 Tax=Planoprotostelium fungivorum TaxID=1890364 RepID=A0A2P6NJF5_9EUKA|nr:hypothetical protein PROFUN_04065 [Planoprotostelium fungivorum]